jgi:hypothetical protein
METQADVKKATQENLKILYDPEYSPFVDFYDNHQVHIQTHEKFVKVNYERISPIIMQKYKIHILDHFREIAKQQIEIQKAQQEGAMGAQAQEHIEQQEEKEQEPFDINELLKNIHGEGEQGEAGATPPEK